MKRLDIQTIDKAALLKKWKAMAYPHQLEWFNAKDDAFRSVLVDRQCGLTFAMALEGAFTFIETGRHQVFVSTTRDQANVFNAYINHFFGGDVHIGICVSPVTFLRLAPDYDFDVYISEYLWMKSEELAGLVRSLEVTKPVRQTWMTARAPDPKFNLLEQVTHKVSRGLDGDAH